MRAGRQEMAGATGWDEACPACHEMAGAAVWTGSQEENTPARAREEAIETLPFGGSAAYTTKDARNAARGQCGRPVVGKVAVCTLPCPHCGRPWWFAPGIP